MNGLLFIPPAAMPVVRLARQEQARTLAIFALEGAVVSAQFGDVHAAFAGALEELRLHQMALTISCAPNSIGVANAKICTLFDRLWCPEHAVAILIEALGQIRHAGVFRKGGRVEDGHVWRIRCGHLVSIDLQSAHSSHDLLLAEFLGAKESVKGKVM